MSVGTPQGGRNTGRGALLKILEHPPEQRRDSLPERGDSVIDIPTQVILWAAVLVAVAYEMGWFDDGSGTGCAEAAE